MELLMGQRSANWLFKSKGSSIALWLAMTFMIAGAAHAQCGKQVQVQEGDTLSSLAKRCDVTEARILDLNPAIQGSKDLRTGMTLSLEPSGKEAAAKALEAAETLFDRLKSYAREARQSLEGVAETVTTSVEDFVQRNPDLHQRVRKLGQRLNIPGMEKVEAQVSLSVRRGPPGTPVTLSAIGLPPNHQVTIAGGPPEGDYEILGSARTTAQGTLQVTVELPQRADPQRDFIFVIASSEHNLAARSATFDVVGAM
jgi:LysM repeat protein